MGIVKEIFADHTLDGNSIPDNIYWIGAVSPFSHLETPVLPLPPSLEELTLNYGSLTVDQEAAFITTIINTR